MHFFLYFIILHNIYINSTGYIVKCITNENTLIFTSLYPAFSRVGSVKLVLKSSKHRLILKRYLRGNENSLFFQVGIEHTTLALTSKSYTTVPRRSPAISRKYKFQIYILHYLHLIL